MNAPARPEPYECDLPVRWSDQDVNGHVNNARVVTLLEELLIAAYLDWTDSTPDAGHPRVVRTLSVDYRHPVHHCTPLTGRLWVSRLGRSSFVMQHALLQRGRHVVTAEAVVVQLEADHSRSRPLADPLRGVLERVLRPDVTASSECEAAPGAQPPAPPGRVPPRPSRHDRSPLT